MLPLRSVWVDGVAAAANPFNVLVMSDLYHIEVVVMPEYMPEQSEPEDSQFVFAYHIRICNVGSAAAQLVSRHWVITDGNGDVDEVQGDGVVGEQPWIAPAGEHQYSSFCVLDTPVGMMQGSYQMKAENGVAFDAEIPPFTLAVPGSLN